MKKWMCALLCALLLANLAGTALAEGNPAEPGPETGGLAAGDPAQLQADGGTEPGNEPPEGGDTGGTGGDGENGGTGTDPTDPADPTENEGDGTQGEGDEVLPSGGDSLTPPPAENSEAAPRHFLVNGELAKYENGVLTLTDSQVTLTMAEGVEATDHAIKVGPGVETIVIDGLRINAQSTPAMDLSGAGSVTVLLKGSNSLTGGSGFAGIATSPSGTLTIGNTPEGGILKVQGGASGAGIGGNNGCPGGTVALSGGSLIASGGQGAAGIGSGAGGAGQGSLTVNGGDLIAQGSPALGAAPVFDPAYIHLSYGGRGPEAKNVAEWSGSPLENWSVFSWAQILPMTVNGFTVTPAETSLTLTPPGPASTSFTAALNVTAGGASLAPLDVTDLAAWSLPNSSASGIRAGALTVPYSEPADSLTVLAKYEATGSEASALVTLLRPATALRLDKTELSLTVGDSAALKATVEPANTTDPVVWSVSPQGIVSVDQQGRLKALAAGTAEVTVAAGAVSAVCKVTVKAPARLYTVRFDPNGGTCGTKTLQTREDGTLPSLPKASKDGVYFAGWYTEKNGGTRVSVKTVFQADTTLYAHWSDVPVTGDANDPVLWAALLGGSVLVLCALGAVLIVKKRKGSKPKK